MSIPGAGHSGAAGRGRYDDIAAELAELEARGLRRRLGGPLPADVCNFSSNDYLGLAAHPDLAEAARGGLARTTGATAARLIGADHRAHRALEARLARFKGTEAALVFSSGYQANVGVIASLAGRGDVVFSDELNHASLIDGCRLSRAEVVIYDHGDAEHLAWLMDRHPGRRRLVVTDSVFGMDGDEAPLQAICALAERHGAWVFVDEAHATGLRGPGGRGLVAERGVRVDVQLTTFGKALGGFGAAVAGPQVIIDYLVNRARTFVFTTALPPAVCAAAERAIDIIDSPRGEALRRRLADNVARAVAGLRALGVQPAGAGPGAGPIVPLILGSAEAAVAASAALIERGYFVQAIRPPTVPPGTSRLRLSISARHTPEQIDGLLAALGEVVGR